MKPTIFKWKDFFAFGLISILSTIASIILFFVLQPFQEAHVLTSVVAIAFWVLYAIHLFIRKADLKGFEFIKGENWGMMVNFGKYKGATKEDIKKTFDETVTEWDNVFGDHKVIKAVKNVKTFWLLFEPMPMSVPGNKSLDGKIAGYTVYNTETMHVGYKDPEQKLETTAFKHELGHILQAGATGVWNMNEHHQRSKEHGLK